MASQAEIRAQLRQNVGRWWHSQLHELGGIWEHDGHPARPHAEFSAGHHSDIVIDCRVLVQNGQFIRQMAASLYENFRQQHQFAEPDRVIGPAYGGIELASYLSGQVSTHWDPRCLSGFAVPQRDASGRKFMSLERCPIGPTEHTFLLCDDVLTTGSNLSLIAQALRSLARQRHVRFTILPFVLVLFNRSGRPKVHGRTIVSLMNEDLSGRTWPAKRCPLCRTGSPALSPNFDNWPQFTATYT